MALSNGLQRTLFAAVAAPVFVGMLWAGGHWRSGLLTFVLGAAIWEFARILRAKFPAIGRGPESLLPTAACALVWLSPDGPLAALGRYRDLAWILVVFACLLWAFKTLPREEVFPWVGLSAAGLAYVSGWGASFFALSAGPRGWESLAPVMMAFGACWTGDTFAYLVGRAVGRTKLCPELSPAKTVEGAIAGIVAPAAFGAWWGSSFLGLDILPATILGSFLGLAGIIGDLAESVLKRWAGVKDSSRMLPGHGGVLDRFDSAFFAVPLLHYALVALAIR